MDLDALRLFVRVSEFGNFSKAAVASGVAQPTISRVVGELERHFGGPLFYRTGRGVTLTDLGEIALPRAQALVRDAEQLTEDVRTHRSAPTGLVMIGLLPSTAVPLVADLHAALREASPNIRLRVFEGFSNHVEQWLSEGRVDIGLLSRYRAVGQADGVLVRVDLVLVGSPDAPPLPARTMFKEIAGLPLVLPAEPNGLRQLVEDTARRQGLSLRTVLEADSLNALKDLVRRCGCYTILAPHSLLPGGTRPLQTSLLVDPMLVRQIVLATSRTRPLGRAARVVLRTLETVARQSLAAHD